MELTAIFPHRDGRLWTATITRLARAIDAGQLLLTFTSSGCREFRYICRSIEIARATALRFANMPLSVLELLTAEAEGTTSHPRPGQIVYTPLILPNGRVELRRGRWCGSQVYLFPHPSEIRDALVEIGTALDPASPVIERVSINSQIPNEILYMFAYGPEGWTLPSLHRGPTLTHQEPDEDATMPSLLDAANRAQRFEQQLAAGEVELPTLKPREDRVISLD